ncbi:hypothetical protein FA13DRAFT_1798487 [Coprinellus micaceus]|uniref:Uncharacterized protein n=1 Tax=Coprinellus micaceus TaxID=71717 RepID=A0A4Y7SM27_COPMI|nr:hypothetical protein FA13DRAFT_1798487 [Coprinellus micaceus]
MATHPYKLQVPSNHQTPEEDKSMRIFLQFIVGIYILAQQILDKDPSEIIRLVELARLTIHPDYLDSYSDVLHSAYTVCCDDRRRQPPAAFIHISSTRSSNCNTDTQATRAPPEAYAEPISSRVSTSISTERDIPTENTIQAPPLSSCPGQTGATPQREPETPRPLPSAMTIADGSTKTGKVQKQRAGKRPPAPTVQPATSSTHSAPATRKPGTPYGTYVRPRDSPNGSTPASPSIVRHSPKYSRLLPLARAIPRHNHQPPMQGVHPSQPISNNARKRPADTSWESSRSKRANTAASTIPTRIACCWAAQLDGRGQHTVCCDALIPSDKQSILLHLEKAHGVKRGNSNRVMAPCLWGAQCPSRTRVTQRELATHIEEAHLKSDGKAIVCENVGCARTAIYVGKTVETEIGGSRAGGARG